MWETEPFSFTSLSCHPLFVLHKIWLQDVFQRKPFLYLRGEGLLEEDEAKSLQMSTLPYIYPNNSSSWDLSKTRYLQNSFNLLCLDYLTWNTSFMSHFNMCKISISFKNVYKMKEIPLPQVNMAYIVFKTHFQCFL